MSNKVYLILFLLSFCAPVLGQEARTQGKTPTGQPKFPVDAYFELPQHEKPIADEWSEVKGVNVSWGDIDNRYAKHSIPMRVKSKNCKIRGWRGERVALQAVVWTASEMNLSYQLTDLKKGKSVIPSDDCEVGFVRYVMGDGLNSKGGGCGHRKDFTQFDSVMVADCIDPYLESVSLSPMSSQGIWVSCRIPRDVEPGKYIGYLNILDGDECVDRLRLDLVVEDKILPDYKDWHFHLDLWQNPFAVARYYQVPLWSNAHFDAMRPIMERLAQAGQKVITASIIDKPWNGQTEDAYSSMVTWIKRLDGTWEYKFDVFDAWVEFMISCGIDKQIDCYSMVPWRLSFRYYDQASDSFQELVSKPGDAQYEEHWLSMLSAFAAHLKEKGWFDICTIAMDERSMEIMKETIKVIRKADKDFKIAFAGNYHPEIIDEIYDYSLAWNHTYPDGVIEKRRSQGMKSTYYTCCTDGKPNTFVFSDPTESFQLAFEMLSRNADGYLRWAFNSWPLEPLLDARFRTWSSGDTFLVYPGNRTSIRFERMIDGIEEYEKVKSFR